MLYHTHIQCAAKLDFSEINSCKQLNALALTSGPNNFSEKPFVKIKTLVYFAEVFCKAKMHFGFL